MMFINETRAYQLALTVAIKNCEPLGSGPVLAIVRGGPSKGLGVSVDTG